MKNIIKTSLAVLFLAFGSAQAADNYFGINVLNLTEKEEGYEDVSPKALSFKLGGHLNENLAAEVRFGTGISNDTDSLGISVDLDNYFGLYLRGIAPLSKTVSLYGLVGYTSGELTFSAGGFSFSETESDVSFGVGLEFAAGDNASVNLEWAQLIKNAGLEIEALSVGFSKKF